jgi:hypothetical protein
MRCRASQLSFRAARVSWLELVSVNFSRCSHPEPNRRPKPRRAKQNPGVVREASGVFLQPLCPVAEAKVAFFGHG